MKIAPDDVGMIAREWIRKSILAKIDSPIGRFGGELLLSVNPGMVDNYVNPKARLFVGEDGLIDVDTVVSHSRNILRDQFGGKLHIPMINYDADVQDIDEISEIARKFAR